MSFCVRYVIIVIIQKDVLYISCGHGLFLCLCGDQTST